MTTPLVEMRDVNIRFNTTRGWGYAVTAVSADVRANTVTAIIGESGSGKSVLGAAVMGLLPNNAEVSGSITYVGLELLGLADREWDQIRGIELGWVAQNPASSLNPVYRIDELVSEAAIHRRRIRRRDKRRFAADLLAKVGLPAATGRNYSFELSGGMAQRALIAVGIGLDPPLLILDEPTKGLDPANYDRIRDAIMDLAGEGHTIMLITHDVTLAEQVADEIWVLYGSRLVEQAPKQDFFATPLHPYSQGLLAAMPSRGLHPIPGESPSFFVPPEGCPFVDRCPYAVAACHELKTPSHPTEGRSVLCLLH